MPQPPEPEEPRHVVQVTNQQTYMKYLYERIAPGRWRAIAVRDGPNDSWTDLVGFERDLRPEEASLCGNIWSRIPILRYCVYANIDMPEAELWLQKAIQQVYAAANETQVRARAADDIVGGYTTWANQIPTIRVNTYPALWTTTTQ